MSPEPACPVNIYVHRNIIIGACSERADLKAMRTRAARRVGSSTESLPGVIPRFGCSDSEDACARSGTDPTVDVCYDKKAQIWKREAAYPDYGIE